MLIIEMIYLFQSSFESFCPRNHCVEVNLGKTDDYFPTHLVYLLFRFNPKKNSSINYCALTINLIKIYSIA